MVFPCFGPSLSLSPFTCMITRYPVESVQMMRSIIYEAESWRASNPELVLPAVAEVAATSEMEGIASAAVHTAHSLSESIDHGPRARTKNKK